MRKKRLLLVLITIFIVVNLAVAYNKTHFKIYKQGIEAWNKWRKNNPNIKPNLSGITFKGELHIPDFKNTILKRTKWINFTYVFGKINNSDLSYSIFKNGKTITCRGCFVRFKNVIMRQMKISNCRLVIDFWNTDFSNTYFTNTSITGNFINTNFKNAKLNKTEIVIFNGYNNIFFNAIIHNSAVGKNIEKCVFSFSKISNSEIYTDLGILKDTNFSNAKIINTKFVITNKKSKNISFINSTLTNSKFVNCYLNIVNFTNANLTNVNFHKAKFKNVVFKNADMRGAKISRKYYNYIKRQGVRNFNKIKWID